MSLISALQDKEGALVACAVRGPLFFISGLLGCELVCSRRSRAVKAPHVCKAFSPHGDERELGIFFVCSRVGIIRGRLLAELASLVH